MAMLESLRRAVTVPLLLVLAALLLLASPAGADSKKSKGTAHKANAAANLPPLKGQSVAPIEKTLLAHGFTKTKTSNSAAKNQTWRHRDGSEVRVHPYGDQNEGQYKSGNNAHLHKEDPQHNQLDDHGATSADKNATHIGIKNPPDLPAVRGRPHGAGK